MTEREMPQQVVQTTRVIHCKYCDGENLVKYGTQKGVHQYLCRTCNRKFGDTPAMPGKRVSPELVGEAVSSFYGGMSLRDISRNMGQTHGTYPSKSTLYEWVVEQSRKASKHLDKVKANVGETWVADEMAIRLGGKQWWLWDCMDSETRYLLASHLSPTRTVADADTLFRKAARRATKPPRFIVTDRLAAYDDGIEHVFGADTIHVHSLGMRDQVNNNLAERLQGTIRQRTKVMRGLKTPETAKLVMDGYILHYNHFRPHESLKNRTPGEVAGVEPPFKDWDDVARLRETTFDQRLLQSQELRDRTLEDRRFRGPQLRDNRFRTRRGRL